MTREPGDDADLRDDGQVVGDGHSAQVGKSVTSGVVAEILVRPSMSGELLVTWRYERQEPSSDNGKRFHSQFSLRRFAVDQFLEFDVRVGDMVHVYNRSPHVTSTSAERKRAPRWHPPVACPHCGTALKNRPGARSLRCPNGATCQPQLVHRLMYTSTLTSYQVPRVPRFIWARSVEAGLIRDQRDVFKLTIDDFRSDRLLGNRANECERALETLSAAKTAPLGKICRALGWPTQLEYSLPLRLAEQFPSMEALLNVTSQDLIAGGFTLSDAQQVLDWANDPVTRAVVDAWRSAGVVMDDTNELVVRAREQHLRSQRRSIPLARPVLSRDTQSDPAPLERSAVDTAAVEVELDDDAPIDDQLRVEEAERLWARIIEGHPDARVIGRRGRLPWLPGAGCLYVHWPAQGEVVAVVARSLQEAWTEVSTSTDLSNRGVAASRERAIWVAGSLEALRATSPMLARPTNALAGGRPIAIRSAEDWSKAPVSAGIYRITRRDADGNLEIYVGRTGNFRARPRWHEKVADLPWGGTPGIVKIELIRIKAAGALGGVDLDEAEKIHVVRARKNAQAGGPRVLNDKIGGNGPPSRVGPRIVVF